MKTWKYIFGICLWLVACDTSEKPSVPWLPVADTVAYQLVRDTLFALPLHVAVASVEVLKDGHIVVIGDRGGRLYLMDGRLGMLRDSVGRRGEGPGEFSGEPFAMDVLHDSLLLVLDARPRFRLHIFTLKPRWQEVYDRTVPGSPLDVSWNGDEEVLFTYPQVLDVPALMRFRWKEGAAEPFPGFSFPARWPENPFYRMLLVESHVPGEFMLVGPFTNRLAMYRDQTFQWYAVPGIPEQAPVRQGETMEIEGYAPLEVPAAVLFRRVASTQALYLILVGEGAAPESPHLLVIDSTMTLQARIPLEEHWKAIAASGTHLFAVMEDTTTGSSYLARYTLKKTPE